MILMCLVLALHELVCVYIPIIRGFVNFQNYVSNQNWHGRTDSSGKNNIGGDMSDTDDFKYM